MYQIVVSNPLNKLSAFFEKIVEKKGIDGMVNGVGKMVQNGSNKLRLLQSGMVGLYLFLMVIGIILLFIIQLWYHKM